MPNNYDRIDALLSGIERLELSNRELQGQLDDAITDLRSAHNTIERKGRIIQEKTKRITALINAVLEQGELIDYLSLRDTII